MLWNVSDLTSLGVSDSREFPGAGFGTRDRDLTVPAHLLARGL